MSRSLALAARSLARRPIATALLALAIALPISAPFALNAIVSRAAHDMMARAESTPLLVGSDGHPFESVLSALTFRAIALPPIPFRQARALATHRRYLSAPLSVRHEARGQPIVGTTLEYFDIRRLQMASGRVFAYAGECVVGATAARRLETGPGDVLVSSREPALEAAGIAPLAMHVVGVLAETGTRDDDAIFVSLETSWIIEGRIHGHPPDSELESSNDDDEDSANQFEDEVTPENLELFHAHGRIGEFPITGIVVVPLDQATGEGALRKWPKVGRTDLFRPADVMASLLPAVLPGQHGVTTTIASSALIAAVTVGLVLALSFLMRKQEIAAAIEETGSRPTVIAAGAVEAALVLLLAALMAAGLVGLVRRELEPAPLPVASVDLALAPEPLDVLTVNEPLRYLAARLGGRHVSVSFPAPEGQDPTHWIPSPEVVARYQNADVVLVNGAADAHWTRMASLRSASLIDSSRVIRKQLIPAPGPGHTHGPDEPSEEVGTAPGTWMDPLLAGRQAEEVSAALSPRLAKGFDIMPPRLKKLAADLLDVHARIRAATEPLRGETVLFSSPEYAYFARRYELEGPTLGWAADTAPTDEQWNALATLLRDHPARVMFWSAPPLPETRDRLAAMGVRSTVYESGAARSAGSDYLSTLRGNVVRLEAATAGLAGRAGVGHTDSGSEPSAADSGPP